MKTIVFDGIMTAITSISHIGDTYGVNARLRREKIIQPDGTVEIVPIISGNAIRGILRDRGMYHMLRVLGYGVNETTGDVTGLSLAAFYFLFSGGALTKAGSKRGLDVDEARKWREKIPLVSVFGGAMGNQIMDGKLMCGKCVPICSETAHIIPERFCQGNTRSVWEMCQEEAYTRRDDAKNENIRYLIAPEERRLLDAHAADKRSKSGTEDDIVTETGQTQQMRYYVETLAAGTQLYFEVALRDVSDLEREAFFATLIEFSKMPYIGGKSAVGHGKVSVEFDNWIEINSRVATGSSLSFTIGNLYHRHLQECGDDIRNMLDSFA